VEQPGAVEDSGTLPRQDRDVVSARRYLEQGQPERALEALAGLNGDADAERESLRGAAHFRLEQYAEAARSFESALAKGGPNAELEVWRSRAAANAVADVRQPVPQPRDVVATTEPAPGKRDAWPAPADRWPSRWSALALTVGKAAGLKAGAAVKIAARTLGREDPDSLWTSWYRKSFLRSVATLAAHRERLDHHQLFDAYPRGQRVGFADPALRPPVWARRVRTADGSWNTPDDPLAGAAHTRFGFNTAPSETVPEHEDKQLLVPNPRKVSRVLLTRNEGFKPVPFLNLTAAAWIQFMNHDWVSYGDPSRTKFYRIPLDEDDPVRQRLHLTEMLVGATPSDPSLSRGAPTQTHINEVTSWWDGSQLYGSDAETQHALRSHVGGKLVMDPVTGNLPVEPDGVERTGFRRNWWLGLSMLHTLFAKEHNAICDRLRASYPEWSDDRLFDTARLINAAVMAKIHTVEWTPAILPNRTLNMAMNANWYGAATNLLRKKKERKTKATINIADPIAGGLVGNATENWGVPYSLTREFLAVYRLHSLLPEEVELFSLEGTAASETLPLAKVRQRGSHEVTNSRPMAELFYSFGRQHPGQLVLNNYPRVLQELSIPGAGFYDLGAVDILRDRERGVPRYNAFRRLLGLKPIGEFSDLTEDAEAIIALKSVYDSVEDIDLLIGNLAEQHRPTGFGFGETLFEIFILNASRRLQADRFFTTDYTEEIYTQEGLDWIDQASLKVVLLRHFPVLLGTGLANIENAFEPWDEGPLADDRHPLRSFDPELAAHDARRR